MPEVGHFIGKSAPCLVTVMLVFVLDEYVVREYYVFLEWIPFIVCDFDAQEKTPPVLLK